MRSADTSQLRHARRFKIGGWIPPSSDDTIDVVDSGTPQLFFRLPRPRPRTCCEPSPPLAGRSTLPVASDEPRGTGRVPPGRWPPGSRRAPAISLSLRPRPGSPGCFTARHCCSPDGRQARSSSTPAWLTTYPFEQPARPTAGGEFGLIRREPVGVVAPSFRGTAHSDSSVIRSLPPCSPARAEDHRSPRSGSSQKAMVTGGADASLSDRESVARAALLAVTL